jgi:hypothetical protein
MGLFKPNVEKMKAKGDVGGLIKALKDKDGDVRDAAARALGKMKWKPENDTEKAWYLAAKSDRKKLIKSGKPKVEKHYSVRGKQGRIIIKCSRCGRQLEPIGSMFDSFKGGVVFGQGTEAAFQQWLGWVCTNCHMIFCTDCEHPSMNQPMSTFRCPNCGQTLKAAVAMYLKQIGKL